MDSIKAHLACEQEAHVCAGHPSSVDALVAFDEDTVLTGSQDGLIRVISVLPNRMLGVVGEHGEFPVETLALSQDRCVALRRCLRICAYPDFCDVHPAEPLAGSSGEHGRSPVETLALSQDSCGALFI